MALPANSQVSLSWTASLGATSYNIYRGASSNGESSTPLSAGITTTSLIDGSVVNGTVYFYKIRAVNSGGTSVDSIEVSAMPTLGMSETIGGGTITSPAVGPAPSFNLGASFTLVKNWPFGADGTIKDIADLNANFFYHDIFGTIGNGTNYGAITVATDAADAINDAHYGAQPVENGGTVPVVRTFTADSL